jgi:hypothetical protein
MRTNQNGFGHVVLLIVIVAAAVVLFAGYRVWSANEDKATNTDTSQITNNEDLTDINHELDQAGNELDKGLNDSQLDADIDSM